MRALRGTVKDLARMSLPPGYLARLQQQRWESLRRLKLWRSPQWRRGAGQLAMLRDRHRGERAVILGNGPSLKLTPLERLKNEVLFGLNRIYLLFDEVGFSTDYWVCVNRLVLQQCARDISRLSMPRFVSWRGHDLFPYNDEMVFLDTDAQGPSFQSDALASMWEGATVTYVALQLAFYMGFSEVVLVGVDHSFVTEGRPHEEVISSGADLNHFSPDYFGAGFRWHLPDLETSETAYRCARYAFEAAGRKIVDATIGGKLDVFPKVAFDEAFPPSTPPSAT